MKKLALLLLLALAGCQKNSISPTLKMEDKVDLVRKEPDTLHIRQIFASIPNFSAIIVTIYSGTFKVDGTMIELKKVSSANYVKNEDAIYFQGAGVGSLTSISADNFRLAINTLPLKEKGDTIRLSIDTLLGNPYRIPTWRSGFYRFKMQLVNVTPGTVHIFDSRVGALLRMDDDFLIDLDDPTTYGADRFKVLIK